jgi:hypothetical protein
MISHFSWRMPRLIYILSACHVLQGVTKRMKISRRVVANDGTARKEEKVTGIPFNFNNLWWSNHQVAVNETSGNAYKLKFLLNEEQDTIYISTRIQYFVELILNKIFNQISIITYLIF